MATRHTLRDYMCSSLNAQSCINFSGFAYDFDFNPEIIQILPKFHGFEYENPCEHLEKFELVCYFVTNSRLDATFRLKLFPFSLNDEAKDWFHAFNLFFIKTWDELQNAFLEQFSPIFKTFTLKQEIQNFSQNEGEVFYKCWERFQNLLQLCPNHGFELWQILGFFYNSLSLHMYKTLDLISDGEFLDLTPKRAWNLLETLFEYSKPKEIIEPKVESSTFENHINNACSTIIPLSEDHHNESNAFWSLSPLDSHCETNEHELLNEFLTIPSKDPPLHKYCYKFRESLEDEVQPCMPLISATFEIEAQSTLESVDFIQPVTTLENERHSAHVSQLEMAPLESPIKGIVSDELTETTDFWEDEEEESKLVVIEDETKSVTMDFLGIEHFIKPCEILFNFEPLILHLGLCEPHKENFDSMFYEHERPKGFMNPFVNLFARLGIG